MHSLFLITERSVSNKKNKKEVYDFFSYETYSICSRILSAISTKTNKFQNQNFLLKLFVKELNYYYNFQANVLNTYMFN